MRFIRKGKWLPTLAGLLACVTLLAGCRDAEEPSDNANFGGMYISHPSVEPSTLLDLSVPSDADTFTVQAGGALRLASSRPFRAVVLWVASMP